MSTRPGPRLTGGTPLRGVSEEDVLARILPLFTPHGDVVVAPGDDAAVLRTGPSVIATTDTMVLGRDWLDEWSSGADVGHKVVAQNLADVAAMGGRPTGVLVTLVADPETSLEWVVDHATGLGEACASAGVAVLGGDLSSAPAGVVTVSVTALGELDGPAVLRSGARPGDVVAVCGSLGLAAAGLRLLAEGRESAHPDAVARQRRPVAPLAAGPVAARHGATSMLDISDGLLKDGERIATASGVVLDLSRALLAPAVEVLAGAVGEPTAWECVLGGGEEHSLLGTFPSDVGLPMGWWAVGRVREPGDAADTPGVRVDGAAVRAAGWDHFTS